MLKLASFLTVFSGVLLLPEVSARTGCGFLQGNETHVLFSSLQGCFKDVRKIAVETAFAFFRDGGVPLSKQIQIGMEMTFFPPSAAGCESLPAPMERG